MLTSPIIHLSEIITLKFHVPTVTADVFDVADPHFGISVGFSG